MNTATATTPSKVTTAKVAPISVKLTPVSRERLRSLAGVQRRPAHALVREAIDAYLEAQEEEIKRNQEADASWKHYQDTGLHITGEEAIAWIKSWGTPNQLPKPVCHV
jgi:predicted transcriptional regulator